MIILRERIADVIFQRSSEGSAQCKAIADSILIVAREPDPRTVARAADALGMNATQIAAVWMTMIDMARD